MPVKSIYDSSVEDAGVLSDGTGKVWYEKLVGGLRWLEDEDLQGAQVGFEFDTWMIDTSVYLGWYVFIPSFCSLNGVLGCM